MPYWNPISQICKMESQSSFLHYHELPLMSPILRNSLLALCLLSAAPLLAQKEARLLRFPAIHGDRIVFTYAGNLYTVPSHGGVARKLTNDVGFEVFPRFSPDGSTIAFTAQYDGNTEVYTMPADGGVPQRVT